MLQEIQPLAGEKIEDLQLAGLKILQKEKGFRYGMDAVLLADFARMGRRDAVADFGTGTGILPLLLYGRGKGKTYDAFEIQPDMADMASRTMALNCLEETIRVHCMRAEEAHTILGYGKMDAVVCNPPYGIPGGTLKNPDHSSAIARHQDTGGIMPFLLSAYRILRVRGRFSMIYPAQRMLEAMEQMDQAKLTPKRIRMVYPSVDKPANLVLIEGQKEAAPLLHQEPPLIVHEKDGQESEEIRRIYHLESET